MSQRRVVVTGLGMLSPLGLTVAESWANILAGKSGIGPITSFDAASFPVQIAGELSGFNAEDYFPLKDIKKMDACLQYGIVSAIEAFNDSGIEVNDNNAGRIGVSIGSGIGGLTTMENNIKLMQNVGPRKISPFFIPASIINMISGHVAIRYGLKGPNVALVSACTTGTHNIGYAARTIAYGDADVMLAGGAEKASCPIGVGGFAAARALSKNNAHPAEASRPWDKDRDGFVLGDGAGTLVLEEYEHAKARGAHIYAELVGFGMSADAYHMTLPDGIGAYAAMENALHDAALNGDQIDYVNAHATSTVAGDRIESDAIKKIAGSNAKQVLVSSTKSMIGHLLGAAGAVEAIFSVLAIKDQVAPPTINLVSADEGCDLDYVPNEAKAAKIDNALSNSFGFGGTNGSLIFQKI